jgi:hypothetical protein
MREKMTSGEAPYRKAHLGALLERVEVDDGVIRIIGQKDVLEEAVMREGGPVPGVRCFVRNWRRGRDSNPRYTCAHNGFRDRPIQPLWHLSTRGRILVTRSAAPCKSLSPDCSGFHVP